MGSVIRLDARERLGVVIERTRAAQSEFVVLGLDAKLFAFRLDELEEAGDADTPAALALRLEAWKASAIRGGAATLRDPGAPSTWRTITVDAHGEPVRVDEHHGQHAMPYGGQDEGSDVVRYPHIDATERPDEVRIAIDLTREATSVEPVRITGLPDDWTEIAIGVSVSSPQLAFDPGEHEGTVRVRRNADSVKCRLIARRRALGPLEITAHFTYEGRACGTTTYVAAPLAIAPSAPSSEPAAGAFALPANATPPDLTIYIHRTGEQRRRLVWTLVPAPAHRALVAQSVAESELDDEPSAYVAELFRLASNRRPGEHVAAMNGIGESLWDRAPQSVRDAYWSMRVVLGAGFSIQFMTDEPSIPWELMRPIRDGEVTELLARTHPVARGLQKYPDRLRPTLPARGRMMTAAPDYNVRGRMVALNRAREESAMLCTRFNAIAAPTTVDGFMKMFADADRDAIRLVHFAGHGKAGPRPDAARIYCEDGEVAVTELRTAENCIGERYATFIVLNACEAGAAGDVLGDIGGWGEAFAYRKFSGFVAPLWTVFDVDASTVVEQLFAALLERKQTVGEALRDIRAAHGERSPTFLSYVYYGDVNARFA